MRQAPALVAALILALTWQPLQAARTGEEPAARRSLAGQLLVAEPGLGDPNFSHTVVLMIQHDAQGALGLVLNRPYGKVLASELLRRLGMPDPAATGEIVLHYGGPVQPEIGMVVHSADYALPDTRRVTGELSVTSSPEILRAIGTGRGPRRAIALLGYAGWAPGQLESEIVTGAWFTIPADPDLVLGAEPGAKWPEAVRRRGVEL